MLPRELITKQQVEDCPIGSIFLFQFDEMPEALTKSGDNLYALTGSLLFFELRDIKPPITLLWEPIS